MSDSTPDDELRSILQQQQGRHVVMRFLGLCGYGQDAFASDPLSLAHNVGKHNVARAIIEAIGAADEQAWPAMLAEQAREQAERSAALALTLEELDA